MLLDVLGFAQSAPWPWKSSTFPTWRTRSTRAPFRCGEDITLAAQKNILLEAHEEDVAVQARKEVLLVAMEGNVTVASVSKKVVAKAADDIEIAASGVARIMGSDIKWSKP